MIFDIDHIGLSSLNFKKTQETLLKWGYSKKFREENLKNLEIKRPFLSVFPATHDLELWYKDGSYGIELLNHNVETNNYGYITPMFFKQEANSYRTLDNQLLAIESSDILAYYPSGYIASNVLFNTITVQSSNILQTVDFFLNFGFTIKEQKDLKIELEFNNFMKQVVYYLVIFKQSKGKTDHAINDRGFTNIAMVTNDAYKERERLKNKGLFVTDIDELIVNNKKLCIFYTKGANNEIVELYSIK